MAFSSGPWVNMHLKLFSLKLRADENASRITAKPQLFSERPLHACRERRILFPSLACHGLRVAAGAVIVGVRSGAAFTVDP